jgi:type I restriction enzyme R subunit
MGITGFTETGIEESALAWFEALEYRVLFGPDIAPGETMAEREEYSQVVLERRLREALQRLNPSAKDDAISEAFRKLINLDSPSLVINNQTLHRYLVEGVSDEFSRADNSIGADIIKVSITRIQKTTISWQLTSLLC